MFIFYDLLWIIFFTFLFLSIYFLYEKLMSIKSLLFLRVSTYIIDLFNGATLGFATVLIEIVLRYFDSDFSIPIFFIIGLILLVKKNEIVSIIALAISFIFYIFFRDITPTLWYLFGSLIVIHFIYLILLHYENKENAIKTLFASTFIFLLIGFLVIGLAFKKNFGRETFESSFILFISLVFIYTTFDIVIKFSISSNILFESTNYVFSKYIRHSLSERAIGNYISQNKLKYGVFGLFEYNVTNKKEPNNNEIRDSILTLFENKINSNAILFSYQKNIFGFFIPKKSLDNLNARTVINEIKSYLLPINTIFQTIDNIKYTVEMHAALSFYGKNENTISQLEKNCIFQIKIMNKNVNNVSIFDYKKYKEKLINSKLVEFMDEQIDLNLFLNKKLMLYDVKTNKHISNFIYTDYNDEYVVLDSFEKMLRINKWKNTFNKFFASDAINKYQFNEKIHYIEYSSFVLEDNFSLKNFQEKLDKKNINLNNIVWYFSYEDLIKSNKLDFIVNVISKKYKIALTNFEKAKIFEINKINPYALINTNDTKLNSKFKKFKIIFTNVNNFKSYDDLDKNANIEIGGMLLNNKYDFLNLKNNVKYT